MATTRSDTQSTDGQWTDRVVQLDRTALHIRSAGSTAPGRPAVVVLHDAGGESVDAPAWNLVARTRRVHQVLLPGFGDSPPPPPDGDMAWVTDVLATAVRTLWSDPVVLVGTSLGGWFALETALQHPDIACGLLLLDSAGLHTPTSYLFRLFLDGQGQGGHDGLIGPLMAAHEAPDEPPMVAAYTTTMTAAALHSWNAHVPDPSLLVRATALDLPTRILWGAKDALIPVSHGRALTDAIRGAELFVIPDAGHLLAIDAPEEVMGRLTGMPLRSGPTCPSMNTD